jgi:hypothetical protein
MKYDSHAKKDRLCGLLVRIPSYKSLGLGSIPGTTKFFFREVVGLERGPLSLMSTIKEPLERKKLLETKKQFQFWIRHDCKSFIQSTNQAEKSSTLT